MRYPIYDLSYAEAEILCRDILNTTFGTFISTPTQNDNGFDFIGERQTSDGKQRIAVEVKHRKTIQQDTLHRFSHAITSSAATYDEYIFLTTAQLSESDLDRIKKFFTDHNPDTTVKILDLSFIIEALSQNPSIAARYFVEARKARNARRVRLAIYSSCAAGSITFLAWTNSSKQQPSTSSIEHNIQFIDNNLKAIHDLENNLRTLQNEIKSTDAETKRIKSEYDAALQLKSITQDQLEKIRATMNQGAWTSKFIDLGAGFILGFAASVLANMYSDWRKKMAALNSP